MKKLLFILSLCTASVQLSFAQTTLTTAVNIIGTDIHGNPYNLFNSLNAGKYVVLDFMFTTCGTCQATAPALWQAFNNYGCNGPGAAVEWVTINKDDNNAVMSNWETTYMSPTGPYPIALSGTQGGPSGGPQSIYNTWGVFAFPTMVLVAPNKSIVYQDMWPISSAADFNPYFQSQGISQNPAPCNLLNSAITEEEKAEKSFSVSPVPAYDKITVKSSTYQLVEIKIIDMLGKIVYASKPETQILEKEIDICTLEAGIYFAEVSMNGTVVKRKFVKS